MCPSEPSSSGSDDDDEDDDEAGPSAPVAADNKRLKGEVSRHKAQLEALKQKDPEFYEYLRSTDAELLGFGEGEEEDEDEEAGSSQEGDSEEEGSEGGEEDEAADAEQVRRGGGTAVLRNARLDDVERETAKQFRCANTWQRPLTERVPWEK